MLATLFSGFAALLLLLIIVVLCKAVVVSMEQYSQYKMLSVYDGPAPRFPWGNIVERAANRLNQAEWQHANALLHCKEKLCFRVQAPFFFRSFCGSSNELVSADPKIVKHVLCDRFDVWAKSHIGGRNTSAVELVWGKGIFLADHGIHAEFPRDQGRIWSLQRRLIAGAMTTAKFKHYYLQVFQEHSTTLVKTLKRQVGAKGETPIDFQFWMHVLTMDSLIKVAFGGEVGGVEGGVSEYTLAYDRLVGGVLRYGETNIKTILLRELLPVALGDLAHDVLVDKWCPVMAGIKKDIAILYHHTQQLLDEKRVAIAAGEEGASADLLGQMLLNLQEDVDSGTKEALSDRDICEMIHHIIVAGRDTTAETVSWLFYELGLESNKHLLDGVQEELKLVLDGAAPSHEDLQELPFLRALIWETLRLHPVGYQIQVTAKTDDVLPDGVHVPEGTRMALSVYSLGRSKAVYGEDAEEFRPERWIPFKQPDQYVFPMFKAGRRICPGKDMALLEMGVAAAVLLQSFSPQVVDPKDVTISCKLTMACRQKESGEDGLVLRLIPRE